MLIFTVVLALFSLISGTLGQLVSSSTTGIAPVGSTKSSCGAHNVMVLCVQTNTEKQAGCVAFPDPRLCQCQYQHAVVTCYDLCKGDVGATAERPRAEGDTVTLCQGYNNSQIFPPQRGNPATQPSASSLSPSKAIPGQGASAGVPNTPSKSSSLQTNSQTQYLIVALMALTMSFVVEHFS
ncbi:hypothetical protein K7432_001438 [Basidiobolus ranarum]|uniref:Uncharacterized protein n=1 Tax=Basidiobolus ranarum TaxID=34480 RepID=A0ABR2X2Z2_9FUNG